MDSFFATYLHDRHNGFLLIFWATVILFAAALFFFVFTYIRRHQKIRKVHRKANYQAIIDETVFSYLFGAAELEVTVWKLQKSGLSSNRLFKKITLKTLLSLFRNYSDEQKRAITRLYVESGLVNYSVQKLRSGKWAKTIEAIRDLSTLRITEQEEEIRQHLHASHDLVQREALLGMIKLKGLIALEYLYESKVFLNDWTQANILQLVKTGKIKEPDDLLPLLTSTNSSHQLLGVRLVDHFRSVRYLNVLKTLEREVRKESFRSEVTRVTQQLLTLSNNKE